MLPDLARELQKTCPDLSKRVILVGREIEKSHAKGDTTPHPGVRKNSNSSSSGRITKVCKVKAPPKTESIV